MSDTTQRVAIVTGGGRGIGAATASRLAADGLAVAVLDLKEDMCSATVDAITAAGGKALAVGADVSESDQVAAAVDKVASELGPPAVLVNNAGVLRDNMLFKMSVDDWDTVMQVHLRGAFLMTKASQKHMVDQKFGRIINLSSTSALGNRGQANYSAAKAGMQGLTKTLAKELGKFGITVNAVCPGMIDTELTREHATPDALAKYAASYPVPRLGTAVEVADLICFAASEAAGYITGASLDINGGDLMM